MFLHYRKSFYAVLFGVVFVVIFSSGFYFGKQSVLESKEISLLNKELPAGVETDFTSFWKAWSILDEKFVSKKEMPKVEEFVIPGSLISREQTNVNITWYKGEYIQPEIIKKEFLDLIK